MKKTIITLLFIAVVLCGIYATDINMEGRLGAGYLRDLYDVSAYRYHTDCFSISIGTDLLVEPVKNRKIATEIGFGANLILGYGNRRYDVEKTPQNELIAYLAIFCGPVVKWHFTDLFSARLSLGYVGLPTGAALGLDVGATYAISDKWSLGIDVIGAADVPLLIFANAVAIYKF